MSILIAHLGAFNSGELIKADRQKVNLLPGSKYDMILAA